MFFQVECNSRLNPTKTTLLKVKPLLQIFRHVKCIHICKHDLLMRLMSSQMADCGGLPQVVQVSFFVVF